MKRTQLQMYYQQREKIAAQNRHVMEMINHPTNPLTKNDLHKLADRFPQRWEKYRKLLDDKP